MNFEIVSLVCISFECKTVNFISKLKRIQSLVIIKYAYKLKLSIMNVVIFYSCQFMYEIIAQNTK